MISNHCSAAAEVAAQPAPADQHPLPTPARPGAELRGRGGQEGRLYCRVGVDIIDNV